MDNEPQIVQPDNNLGANSNSDVPVSANKSQPTISQPNTLNPTGTSTNPLPQTPPVVEPAPIFAGVNPSRQLGSSPSPKKSKIIPITIIIICLIIIGAAADLIFKPAKTETSNSSTKTAASSFASWKTYCDSQAKFCFKYPRDWQFKDSSSGDFVAVNIWSPQSDVTAAYLDQPSTPTSYSPFTFYTISINNTSSANSQYKVIAGNMLVNGAYSPSIQLSDATVISTDKLEVGKNSQVQNFPITDNKLPGHQITLSAGPKDGTTFTSTQATQWYNGANSKVLERILESTYLEQ